MMTIRTRAFVSVEVSHDTYDEILHWMQSKGLIDSVPILDFDNGSVDICGLAIMPVNLPLVPRTRS